jgi:mannose-6-phosphate isomerase
MSFSTPYHLTGAIQHYAWGGHQFIPELLGQAPNDQPCAEYWMGAHLRGMSKVSQAGVGEDLDQLIKRDPILILGEKTASQFANQLPFLFKVLDVDKMLSIQAHPNKAEAERGFADENAKSIPLNAYNRNFKDDNHKQEMMLALTDFWLLHGFSTPEAILRALENTPELTGLLQFFAHQDIQPLYLEVMQMPQTEVDRLLEPLAQRLLPQLEAKTLDKNGQDYWAAKALRDFRPAEGRYDRGVISIYLMNVVYIPAGQGIFQDAGVLHAYLEGVNVELMANSDNVFRGGLTDKFIDAPTLLEHLSFAPITPHILSGELRVDGAKVFKTPAPDFELSVLKLTDQSIFTCEETIGPEIHLVLEGEVVLNTDLQLERGETVFFPAVSRYQYAGNGVVCRAGMPTP